MDAIFKTIGILLFSALATAFVIVLLMFRRIMKFVRRASQQFNSAASQQQQQSGKRRAGKDGEIIIDRNTSERMSRKIFKENEGEYVDFS